MNYLPYMLGGAAAGYAARGLRSSWLPGHKRPFRREAWPARSEQLDEYGYDEDDWEEGKLVWHITDRASAQDILAHGFKPQPHAWKPPGVSVSVLPASADGLLRTARRMNSFRSFREVEDWFFSRGISREALGQARGWHRRNPSPLRARQRETPASLYLDFQGDFHPAIGGSATIPFTEFLWNDLGRKLVNKDVVAVAAIYTDIGRVPPFRAGAIEAEEYVVEDQLRPWDPHLYPSEIVETIRA